MQDVQGIRSGLVLRVCVSGFPLPFPLTVYTLFQSPLFLGHLSPLLFLSCSGHGNFDFSQTVNFTF
jgi:hypothetical protein